MESLAFKFASKIYEKRKSTIITFEDPSWQCVCVPACLITLVHFLVIKCTLSFARLPQQWRQSQCSHCTRCERIKKVSCKKSLFLQLKLPKVCITLAQCIFYSILWPIPFFLSYWRMQAAINAENDLNNYLNDETWRKQNEIVHFWCHRFENVSNSSLFLLGFFCECNFSMFQAKIKSFFLNF